MITCVYCGTNFEHFQSNCDNCGGILPAPEIMAEINAIVEAEDETIPEPPAPPRQISNKYILKLMLGDGASIVALVFTILGIVFLPLGIILTFGIITAFVGIPFAGLGALFFFGGIALGVVRYQEKQKIIEVLRNGLAVMGEITQVEQNMNVRVNNRNPWKIKYVFDLAGSIYQGAVTTLNTPGIGLQPGRKANVLYLKESPKHNSLYPHP